MRNPWDIAIDAGFNLLGTDNDQTQGDRIIMPFFGAHFGWGHRYSSHWTGEGNLPTVPVSGPMTSGSWAGIVYHDHEHFPPAYRNVFFVNDWMFGTYVIGRLGTERCEHRRTVHSNRSFSAARAG